MANCKRVDIRGRMPFDCVRKPVADYLATMNAPCIGVRITWGDHRMVPNEHGGDTAVYDFRVSGIEAVSWSWIDAFKDAVKAVGGTVVCDTTVDIEGG